MHSAHRRLARLEQEHGITAAQDAADGAIAHAMLITKLEALTERLAEPDAQPTSQIERLAWLMSRDSAAAAVQLRTLITERYGNAYEH